MNALLWVLVVFGFVNVFAVLWAATRDEQEPTTTFEFGLDIAWHLGLGAWALWLLAKA